MKKAVALATLLLCPIGAKFSVAQNTKLDEVKVKTLLLSEGRLVDAQNPALHVAIEFSSPTTYSAEGPSVAGRRNEDYYRVEFEAFRGSDVIDPSLNTSMFFVGYAYPSGDAVIPEPSDKIIPLDLVAEGKWAGWTYAPCAGEIRVLVVLNYTFHFGTGTKTLHRYWASKIDVDRTAAGSDTSCSFGGISYTESDLTITPSIAPADGSTTVSACVDVKDVGGNPLADGTAQVQIWSGGPMVYQASHAGAGRYCAEITCGEIGVAEVTAWINGSRVHDRELLECTPPVCNGIDKIELTGSSHSFPAVLVDGVRQPSAVALSAKFSKQGKACIPAAQTANDCNLASKVCWKKPFPQFYKWETGGPSVSSNTIEFHPPQTSGYRSPTTATVAFQNIVSNPWVMCAPVACSLGSWDEAQYNEGEQAVCTCPSGN